MRRPSAAALALALVAASAALVGWPLLVYGYNGNAHDAQHHSHWTVAFTRQLWEGELWPRWLTQLNDGLGSPTFFYYAPLPYWVNGLLRPLVGWDPVCCWKILGVSSFLALLASGLFAFGWLRGPCTTWGAALGACLYVVAPYHLEDVYERGAFAETWAMAWMPAVMWAADGVAERRPRAVPLLALAYAALVMTHLPTTLMFSLVPLAWAAVRGREALQGVATGMALGAGLGAAYLFPALGLRDAVTIDQLNPSAFAHRFLLPAADGQAEVPSYRAHLVKVASSTVLLAVAGCLLAAPSRARAVWAGVAAAAALMTTGWSVVIWWVVPVLQTVQFPWRFLTVLTLAAAALAALGLSGTTRAVGTAPLRETRAAGLVARTRSPRSRASQAAGLAALLVVAWLWVPIDARLAALPREAGPKWAPDMHIDAPEYTTNGRRASLGLVRERLARPDGTMRPAVLFAFGSLDTARHDARHYTFIVEVDQEAMLWVGQLWFPGWTATLDGQPWPLERNVPMGLPQLRVPAGRHVVDVRLAPTWPEVVGGLVTLASLALLISRLCRSRRAERSPHLPALDLQSSDPFELPRVAGDQGAVVGQGDSGDQHVVAADGPSLSDELRA